MGVESLEPIMHSGFFCLQHSVTIAEQKKLQIEGFCRELSSQNIPKGSWRHRHKRCWCRKGANQKKFLSQNRIEILVFINLGRFPINKTQK
jgi:hypothetical protein